MFILRAGIFLSGLIGLLLALTACVAEQETLEERLSRIPTITPDPAKEDMPAFLHDVWPSPGSTIPLQEYTPSVDVITAPGWGVGVAVWGSGVNIPLNEGLSYIVERSTLLVDGEKMENDTMLLADGLQYAQLYDKGGEFIGERFGGPLYMSGSPELGIGIHQVHYIYRGDDGEIFEYQWEFTIVEAP